MRGSHRKLSIGILFIILLLPLSLLSLSTNEYKFNFKKENISSDKSEEIFRYHLSPQSGYEFSFLRLLLKTILSLSIISGIIYLILKFSFRARSPVYAGGDLFRVIVSYPLAPNRYIQLIEIGNILLLLGITENGINLLTKIDDPKTIDILKVQMSQSQITERNRFSHHFKEFLKGFWRKELFDGDLLSRKKVAFLKEQQAKLKRLG